MKQQKSSGSSLFLMEILLNILLFSFMLSYCLLFFIKAHKLTTATTELERAVTTCSGVADIFETGDGSLDSVSAIYNHGVFSNQEFVIYLDKNFIGCASENAVYTIIVSLVPDDSSVSKASIRCQKSSDVIYELTACRYNALTPYESGGDGHE